MANETETCDVCEGFGGFHDCRTCRYQGQGSCKNPTRLTSKCDRCNGKGQVPRGSQVYAVPDFEIPF